MLQTNCTLTKVGGVSGAESYDGPAAAGPDLWNGESLGYLREKRQPRDSAEGRDIVLDRVLLVEGALEVDWQVGQTVTVERLSGEIFTASVLIVQRPEISDPEIPADVITVRLTLDPA